MPVEGGNLLNSLSLHFLQGLITHKFAYMLDSLVRVSRRVKFKFLINSYFLHATYDECVWTWRRFDTNVDLEYLSSINERQVYLRQPTTLYQFVPSPYRHCIYSSCGLLYQSWRCLLYKVFHITVNSYKIKDARCGPFREKCYQPSNRLLSLCDKLISCAVPNKFPSCSTNLELKAQTIATDCTTSISLLESSSPYDNWMFF
jgi:hypothetical protein